MAFQGGRQLVTITDQTANRVLNQDYKNTSGRPMLVIVSVQCITHATTEEAQVIPLLNGNTQGVTGIFGGIVATLNLQAVFVIPNGETYRVNSYTTGSATVTLENWFETLLIGSTGAI